MQLPPNFVPHPKNMKSFHPHRSLGQLVVCVTCQSTQDNLNTSGSLLGSPILFSLTVMREEAEIESTSVLGCN